MKFRFSLALAASLALLLSGCSDSNQSDGLIITGEVVRCTDIRTIENASEDLTLECLDGLVGTNVAAIKGPAIINVWGSWCKPCKEEMPYFAEFYATMDPNMQLIGVNVEEKRIEDGRMFARTNGIKWPNLYDGEGITRPYFGMGVPVTWFIGESGNVVHKKVGPVKSADELRVLTFKYLGNRG
jgi:cytochrome c biogenesis protein CcmG, thiol:disulfide interchange protein DsbE